MQVKQESQFLLFIGTAVPILSKFMPLDASVLLQASTGLKERNPRPFPEQIATVRRGHVHLIRVSIFRNVRLMVGELQTSEPGYLPRTMTLHDVTHEGVRATSNSMKFVD